MPVAFQPFPSFDPAKPFYHPVNAYGLQMKAVMEASMHAVYFSEMKVLIDSGYDGLCFWRFRDAVALQFNALFHAVLQIPIHITKTFQHAVAAEWLRQYKGSDRQEAAETLHALAQFMSRFDSLGYDFGMQSNITGERIGIDPDRFIVEVLNHVAAHEHLIALGPKSLLIVTYEMTRDYKTQFIGNTEPIWEFFRHARNAAAHNGKWNLLHGEPRYPAEWRGLRLDPSFHGKHLLGEHGTFGLADPVLLLWDIEQRFPNIT